MYRDTPTSTHGDSIAMNEGRWPPQAMKLSPGTPPSGSSWDGMTSSPSRKSLGSQPATAPGSEGGTQRRKATFRHSDPTSPAVLRPSGCGEPATEIRPRTSGKDARSRSQDAHRLRDTPLRSPYYEDAAAGPLDSPNTRWDKAYGPPAASPIDSAISMTPGRAPDRATPSTPFPPLAGTSPAPAAITIPNRPRKDSKVAFAVSPPSGFSTRPRGSSRSTPPPHLVLKSAHASGGGPEYVKSPFPLPQTGSSWEYDDDDDEDGRERERPGPAEAEAGATPSKKSRRLSVLRDRSGAAPKSPRAEGGGARGGLEKLVSRMAQPFVSEETKRERRVEQLKRGIQHPVDLSDPEEPRDGSWI